MATVASMPPGVRDAEFTADQIFGRTKVRELQLSRLLVFYISVVPSENSVSIESIDVIRSKPVGCPLPC